MLYNCQLSEYVLIMYTCVLGEVKHILGCSSRSGNEAVNGDMGVDWRYNIACMPGDTTNEAPCTITLLGNRTTSIETTG